MVTKYHVSHNTHNCAKWRSHAQANAIRISSLLQQEPWIQGRYKDRYDRCSNSVALVIIDDNPRSLEYVATALARDGMKIFTASNPEDGLDMVYTHRPQVVMTDLVMPHMTGLEVLERITEFDPVIDVVLMTAHYTTDTAVEAIRKGAADYLNKPISLATLRDRVGRIIDAALLRQQVKTAEEQAMETAQFEGIVGRSPQMWEMFSRIHASPLTIALHSLPAKQVPEKN